MAEALHRAARAGTLEAMVKNGPSAEPRDASTVVVVREGAGGLEVFCVERHRRSAFLGGALVFPGGKVDDADRSHEWALLSTPLAARPRSLASDEASARAFAVAVLREALEEAAILPVAGGRLDAEGVLALRRELAANASSTLAGALRERGLTLDTARLGAFARWLTPKAEPKRFDTRFYLLALPEGQEGAHDDHETTTSLWATPSDVLARWERGLVMLMPPTVVTLGLFSGLRTVASAFAVAERTSLERIEPHLVEHEGAMILTLPGDPLHPEVAPPPEDSAAPTRFVFEGGRLVPRRAS